MEPIIRFTGRIVTMPQENVDTDQICPARYMKTVNQSGLGEALFADWRYDAQGRPRPDFILNRPAAQGAAILVAGHNFGSGSSREHAVWALCAYGFRAVISTAFADIFCNNALKNGLLPVTVEAGVYQELLAQFAAAPEAPVTVDLEVQVLTLASGLNMPFVIEAFARHCLLHGLDELGYLLGADDEIAAYETTHPAPVQTR